MKIEIYNLYRIGMLYLIPTIVLDYEYVHGLERFIIAFRFLFFTITLVIK